MSLRWFLLAAVLAAPAAAADKPKGDPADELFRRFDADGDGKLSPEEFRRFLAATRGPQLPPGTRVERNLAYGARGERNTLDLYRPAEGTPGPLPLIIWIHGGGWQAGSKDNPPALPFLQRGFAVAGINYRLSRQAVYPAQIEDCKAAVRFLRANADKYGLDPDRFGAWGASAGGHLVALLATTGDVKELEGDGAHTDVSSRVRCVCDFFGPTDRLKVAEQTAAAGSKVDHDAPDGPVAKLLGGLIAEKKELAAKANPITFLTKDDAPLLIVHGDKDPLVPLAQSRMLAEACRKAGVDCELLVLEGAGHGGPAFQKPETLAKIVAFFEKHLGK